ncbi:hypothetical protein AEGHOMDF_2859 [Methylobacterium soli]|nr:hypothetical protein AEGHOMDF_2859 [Methylobacterium soli]
MDGGQRDGLNQRVKAKWRQRMTSYGQLCCHAGEELDWGPGA